jgi:hypothetical protein
MNIDIRKKIILSLPTERPIFKQGRSAVAFILSISATLLLISDPTQAGGSIALSDLQELTRQSPKLTQQIKAAINKEDRGKGDIICVGGRIGGKYALGGARYAPFKCRFPKIKKNLTIFAKNYVRLSNGKLIPLNKLPDLSPQPEDATLVMKLTTWKWSKLSNI